MTTTDTLLRAYLNDWYDWATNGAPEGKPFSRKVGLCNNIPEHPEMHYLLSRKLSLALGRATYPFGHYNFYERSIEGTQHQCPKRLKWVREQLGIEKEGQEILDLITKLYDEAEPNDRDFSKAFKIIHPSPVAVTFAKWREHYITYDDMLSAEAWHDAALYLKPEGANFIINSVKKLVTLVTVNGEHVEISGKHTANAVLACVLLLHHRTSQRKSKEVTYE